MKLIKYTIYSIVITGVFYILKYMIVFIAGLFNATITPWDSIIAVVIEFVLVIWYLDKQMGRR